VCFGFTFKRKKVKLLSWLSLYLLTVKIRKFQLVSCVSNKYLTLSHENLQEWWTLIRMSTWVFCVWIHAVLSELLPLKCWNVHIKSCVAKKLNLGWTKCWSACEGAHPVGLKSILYLDAGFLVLCSGFVETVPWLRKNCAPLNVLQLESSNFTKVLIII
jgi:hypothetical protein